MLNDLIQDFHLSLFQKLPFSLTYETRIKDAVNMEDLTCLLATVRTLNVVEQLQQHFHLRFSCLAEWWFEPLWKIIYVLYRDANPPVFCGRLPFFHSISYLPVFGAFRLLSFCIGRRLPTLVFCVATHVMRKYIRNTQSCCVKLASADVDGCTAMKSKCTIC